MHFICKEIQKHLKRKIMGRILKEHFIEILVETLQENATLKFNLYIQSTVENFEM